MSLGVPFSALGMVPISKLKVGQWMLLFTEKRDKHVHILIREKLENATVLRGSTNPLYVPRHDFPW
jgi:hypothetical protein